MNLYYQGLGQHRSVRPPVEALPQPARAVLSDPTGYIADQGLVDACNVALMLGQPLLLTGEPGTGKTQFAYNLGWELGLGTPLKFETKSETNAQDLFYRYDALRRFRDAQTGSTALDPVHYVSYNALGQAILISQAPDAVGRYLPTEFVHPGKKRSVVLIDEVDKAPRDFPNDILNELEHLYFRIPELDNAAIEADPALYPIVVITSNSEKDLPDAFLRRCVYYDIPFPDRERLKTIVVTRIPNMAAGDPFLLDALDLFSQLRGPLAGLRKPPSTAELLGWLLVLRQMGGAMANPLSQVEITRRSLSALVKTAADQDQAYKTVDKWIQKQVR